MGPGNPKVCLAVNEVGRKQAKFRHDSIKWGAPGGKGPEVGNG